MQIQIKIKTTETKQIQTTITTDTQLSTTINTTKIAIFQISNKAETLQTKNHADIVTEGITNPAIVKLVLTAGEWDTCPASVEHLDQIRTRGIKIRTTTKTIRTCRITTNTTTLTPQSNKTIQTRPVYVPGSSRRRH